MSGGDVLRRSNEGTRQQRVRPTAPSPICLSASWSRSCGVPSSNSVTAFWFDEASPCAPRKAGRGVQMPQALSLSDRRGRRRLECEFDECARRRECRPCWLGARSNSASDVVGGTHGESAVLGGGRYSANPGPKAAGGLLKPSWSVSQYTCRCYRDRRTWHG